MRTQALTKEQILDLFTACIDNAASLFSAATSNLNNEKCLHVSLGMAELALEELGKSYTCLSCLCLAETDYNWIDFWKTWRDHKIKAYRAFFYEFFCPIKIELKNSAIEGPSLRKTIPVEKEISFYVDFDHDNCKPIVPFESISKEEICNRVGSVLGPLNAAIKVAKLISDNNNIDYRQAISHYALQTLTTEMYQHDVKTVLEQMRNLNKEYNMALDDIWSLFNSSDFR